MLQDGSTTEYLLGSGDAAYLVPASGSVIINGVRAEAGEGLVIRGNEACGSKLYAMQKWCSS